MAYLDSRRPITGIVVRLRRSTPWLEFRFPSGWEARSPLLVAQRREGVFERVGDDADLGGLRLTVTLEVDDRVAQLLDQLLIEVQR